MQREPTEYARFLRPANLSGIEALQARFISHRYPLHVHHTWTIAHVVSGAARFQLDGRWQTASAGTSFLIPPGAVHTGESATPGGYAYRVLYIEPERLAGRSEQVPVARRSRTPVLVRSEGLKLALMSMHSVLALPGMALEQGEVLGCLSRELRGLLGSGDDPLPRRVHPIVDAARGFIDAHWRDDFTLDELARAVGYSQFHLAHTFRREMGIPPSGYRRALRVQAAQRLLKTGTSPARAAAECGFYDQAHLTRHFKRITGVTPSVYMRGLTRRASATAQERTGTQQAPWERDELDELTTAQ